MTRLALYLSSLAYPLYWLPNQLAFCALLLTNQSLECQHQFYPTMDRWLIVSTLHGVICEYVQIFHFIFFKTTMRTDLNRHKEFQNENFNE